MVNARWVGEVVYCIAYDVHTGGYVVEYDVDADGCVEDFRVDTEEWIRLATKVLCADGYIVLRPGTEEEVKDPIAVSVPVALSIQQFMELCNTLAKVTAATAVDSKKADEQPPHPSKTSNQPLT